MDGGGAANGFIQGAGKPVLGVFLGDLVPFCARLARGLSRQGEDAG